MDYVLWVSVGVMAFGEVVSGQALVKSSIEGSLLWLFNHWISVEFGGPCCGCSIIGFLQNLGSTPWIRVGWMTYKEVVMRRVQMATIPISKMTGDVRLECENERSQLVSVTPVPTPSTPVPGDSKARASSQPALTPSLEDKVRATQLGKLSVSIPDDCAADVGENSAKLSTQIGLLVRGTIPMATSLWNEVPSECKEYVRIRISDDYNREEDLRTVNMIMAKSYRQFKGRLHEHYKKKGGGNKEVAVRHPHPDMDEDTWTKLCDMFADPKYEETSPSVTSEIGPAELYAASHKRKNGDWLSDVAKDNHEKMRELQEQAISDGRSYTDIDILHQVLGPKPSYVRGLGRAVKPPRTSGSSSTNVARQLREAQLEIDRLKAEREAEVEQMRIEREAEMERMRAERQQEMKELEDRLMREMRERMNDFMANSSHGL
ncbi:hypothetical protein CJ030_MR1G012655 [Morella rubra]|uniref:Uncharacterized protein n=1 Tax=Morella rubra TaxID=262757 RepID=A0A6A1WRD9_9ROSI|nr:hypothetical protein CJ030_MR1G012649 [Morella rubra]KAB1227861.1 hypothetical protein CJ030_MR1G012655 [Morella rubra]